MTIRTVSAASSASSGIAGLVGKRVACMGNSIVQRGNNPTLTTSGRYGSISSLSYLMWAHLLSGGRIGYAGAYATGGHTSTQIIGTDGWLAAVVAAKPDVCICGPIFTNDPSLSVTQAQSLANLATIVSSLKAAGIQPVLVLEPPYNGDTGARVKLNHAVAKYAGQNGLLLLDFHTMFATTAGIWNTTYNASGDGIHPDGLGPKLMGQQVVDALLPQITGNPPRLYDSQLATDSSRLFANPLFLTDTNSDGVPDNVTLSGTGATSSLAADGSTPTSPRVAARGNLMSLTRGSADLLASVSSMTATAGGYAHFGCHVETSGVETAGALITVRFITSDFASELFSLSWDKDIPAGCVLSGRSLIPAGGVGTVVARFEVKTAGSPVLKIGQLTIMDDTALAI